MYGQLKNNNGAMTVSPCSPSLKIEIPDNMKDFSYTDIETAWRAVSESDIAMPMRQLRWAIEHGPALSQWEIDEVKRVMDLFLAKYASPLAEALK